MGFSTIDIPSDDIITTCMHCGLCLPVCPTFAITGQEKSSPRGRIRLIKSVAEGTLDMTDGFIEEMNFCLDCQACETACPAGVHYGSLVESARNQIRIQKKQGLVESLLKFIFLRNVLSKRNLLKVTAKFLWLYQHSGVEWMIRKMALVRLFPKKISRLQQLSPRFDRHYFDEQFPEIVSPSGDKKYTVGFLSGCIMNVAFSKVNADTVEVLLHHDCEVMIPKDQVCCGSLQAHNGDFETAKNLARKNIDVFLEYDLDAIVMNSAGCGAFMKEYGIYFKDDKTYREKAARVSSKIKDISEFLYDIGLKKPEKEFHHSVTYHDACHLVHAQKISRQPRELLQSIPGIEFRELPEASWCCGSAGIYNVVRYDESMKFLDRKIHNIQSILPEYIVANNPGCITQLEYGCKQNDMSSRVVHLASLLREAYQR